MSEPISSARHAAIIPSFLVPYLRKDLPSRLGPVAPEALLCWMRRGDPDGAVRQAIRREVVSRIRARMATVWEEKPGVRLVDGWREKLNGQERERLEQLLMLHIGATLEQLTLWEVKKGMALPLESVIAILARLEALYWDPVAHASSCVLAPSAPDQHDDSKATLSEYELKALASRVQALSWVQELKPDDLRFGFHGGLNHWISDMLATGAHAGWLEKQLNRVLAADAMTYSQEVEDVCRRAIYRHKKKSFHAADRWTRIFLARYACKGEQSTLQEIGDKFAITRERARQICEYLLDLITRQSTALPRAQAVLALAGQHAPASVAELDIRCANLLGAGAGFNGLVALFEDLRLETKGLRVFDVPARVDGGRYVKLKLFHSETHAPDWMTIVCRYARRDCSTIGCSNLIRIAGLLVLNEGVAQGKAALTTVVSGMPGFVWLDQEVGWFSTDGSEASAAAVRIRKMFAVATDPLGVDEIAAALISDDAWFYRTANEVSAIPPSYVLKAMISRWNWVRTIQSNRFAPSGVELSREGLSEPEKFAVQVIESHNGVAAKKEILDAILSKLDISEMAVTAMLASSPIIRKVAHGMYALCGRPLAGAALDEARQRLRQSVAHFPTAPDSLAFYVLVTVASLKNEQYNIPAHIFEQLAVGDHSIVGHDHTARVRQSHSITGINKCFEKLDPGDLIEVRPTLRGFCVSKIPSLNMSEHPKDTLASPASNPDLRSIPV